MNSIKIFFVFFITSCICFGDEIVQPSSITMATLSDKKLEVFRVKMIPPEIQKILKKEEDNADLIDVLPSDVEMVLIFKIGNDLERRLYLTKDRFVLKHSDAATKAALLKYFSQVTSLKSFPRNTKAGKILLRLIEQVDGEMNPRANQ